MSKYLLLCLFNLSFLFNYAQSSDFPKYIDTGNPEKDDAVYAQQKKDWYMSHSDQFKTENPQLGSAAQLSVTSRETQKPLVFEPVKNDNSVVIEPVNNHNVEESESIIYPSNKDNLSPIQEVSIFHPDYVNASPEKKAAIAKEYKLNNEPYSVPKQQIVFR